MTIEDQVQLALAAPYTRICRRDEDGGVSAEVAELPGCYASGATIAEAMEELEDAMASWIQGELEDGHEIPEPSVGPYSGRLNLRIGPRLHERATQLAQAEGISLNRWLTTAIATYAGERPRQDPAAARRIATAEPSLRGPVRMVSDVADGSYGSDAAGGSPPERTDRG